MLPKKISGLKQIASLYKTFFFDLDGVLWKGDEAVPGSFQILQYLRKQNKNLFFITNSSVRGRDQLMRKFAKYNFKANIQECFPSSYFSTLYLKQKYPQIKRVMICGTDELAQQFQLHGFEVKQLKQLPSLKYPIMLEQKFLDLSIQAIVIGWDPQMSFAKQCLVGFHLQNGIKFFGTNPDKYTMIGQYKVPGAGSIIASIETGTNIKAQIMGKPNTFIIDHLIDKNKLNKQQCIMIGDNRQTDITFGNNAGIDTLCVLSGVTKEDDLCQEFKLKEAAIPKYYSNSLYN